MNPLSRANIRLAHDARLPHVLANEVCEVERGCAGSADRDRIYIDLEL